MVYCIVILLQKQVISAKSPKIYNLSMKNDIMETLYQNLSYKNFPKKLPLDTIL